LLSRGIRPCPGALPLRRNKQLLRCDTIRI
jgi:hypothetical protein